MIIISYTIGSLLTDFEIVDLGGILRTVLLRLASNDKDSILDCAHGVSTPGTRCRSNMLKKVPAAF
jgi:hypothetical protein